jgi:hypothetical protein
MTPAARHAARSPSNPSLKAVDQFARLGGGALVCAALVACSGGTSGASSGTPAPPPPPGILASRS